MRVWARRNWALLGAPAAWVALFGGLRAGGVFRAPWWLILLPLLVAGGLCVAYLVLVFVALTRPGRP